MNPFAKRIKLARVRNGFSQREMAQKMNISQSAYAKYEKGITKMDIERLIEICLILGQKPEELFADLIREKMGAPGNEDAVDPEDRLGEAYRSSIKNLKAEIRFLRALLSEK